MILSRKVRVSGALFATLLGIFFWVVSGAAQSVDMYRRLFADVEANPNLYDPMEVFEECRTFVDTYPMSDLAGRALILQAKVAIGLVSSEERWHYVKPQLPAILLCKAKYVYGAQVEEQLFAQALDLRGGLLGLGRAFTKDQKRTLTFMLGDVPRSSSLAARELSFVKRLYQVRNAKLEPIIREEINWFLVHFPAKAPHIARDLLADLALENSPEQARDLRKIASVLRSGRIGGTTGRHKADSSGSDFPKSPAPGNENQKEPTERARTGHPNAEIRLANPLKTVLDISRFLFSSKDGETTVHTEEGNTGSPSRRGSETSENQPFRVGYTKLPWGYVWLESTGELEFDRRANQVLKSAGSECESFLVMLAKRAPFTLLGSLLKAAMDSSVSLVGNDWMAAEFAVNYFRRQAGLDPVRQDSSIQRAARSHAAYVARNGKHQHTEMPSHEGYTGVDPLSRMLSAGWRGNCGGEVMHSYGNPWLDIAGWVASLYHRNGILRPSIVAIGYANMPGVGVMDYGCDWSLYDCAAVLDSSGRTTLDSLESWILYPYPGQVDVPPGWNGREWPDPLPETDAAVGFPVTASSKFCRTEDLLKYYSLEHFGLFGPDGRTVPCWIFPGTDRYLEGFGLIPKKVLKGGSRYSVRLGLKRKGGNQLLEIEWSFTTAMLVGN